MSLSDPPIFTGRFFVARTEEAHIVRIARTALPMAPQETGVEMEQLGLSLAGFDRARTALLVDVRLAPMRNDPASEQNAMRLRPSMLLAFPHSAILVRTAVGRLQLHRLNERDRVTTPVFMDEAEALAHLRQSIAVGKSTPAPRGRANP